MKEFKIQKSHLYFLFLGGLIFLGYSIYGFITAVSISDFSFHFLSPILLLLTLGIFIIFYSVSLLKEKMIIDENQIIYETFKTRRVLRWEDIKSFRIVKGKYSQIVMNLKNGESLTVHHFLEKQTEILKLLSARVVDADKEKKESIKAIEAKPEVKRKKAIFILLLVLSIVVISLSVFQPIINILTKKMESEYTIWFGLLVFFATIFTYLLFQSHEKTKLGDKESEFIEANSKRYTLLSLLFSSGGLFVTNQFSDFFILEQWKLFLYSLIVFLVLLRILIFNNKKGKKNLEQFVFLLSTSILFGFGAVSYFNCKFDYTPEEVQNLKVVEKKGNNILRMIYLEYETKEDLNESAYREDSEEEGNDYKVNYEIYSKVEPGSIVSVVYKQGLFKIQWRRFELRE